MITEGFRKNFSIIESFACLSNSENSLFKTAHLFFIDIIKVSINSLVTIYKSIIILALSKFMN